MGTSKRFCVRTVNASTENEHFVVADMSRASGCMNVFFNRCSAIAEMRRLNLLHYRGILCNPALEEEPDFEHPDTTYPVLDPEDECVPSIGVNGCEIADPLEFGASAEKSKARKIERSESKLAQEMMRKKLVR